MATRKKHRKKLLLHPVMSFIIFVIATVIISGILALLNVSVPYSSISSVKNELSITYNTVNSLLNLRGVKVIFSNTVSNFANFAALSHLIIVLIGIGVMEYTGFLKVAIGLLTRHAKKNVITYLIVLVCILASIMDNLPFIAFMPLTALIFKYGKRNPNVGVIASFAALTCGYGLSILFTSVDSSLLRITSQAASLIINDYTFSIFASILIMSVAIIICSLVITHITESYIVDKIPPYEFEETEIFDGNTLSKNQIRGLVLSGLGVLLYLFIFIYNIIPKAPLGGNFLNYREALYIDKLFGDESFFANGFVFIITILFIIAGLLYGIGAKTIRSNHEFIESLGHSLNGIGKTLVIIFGGSLFISIFKLTNIGEVITTFFANIIAASSFSGVALIILLFVLTALSTLVLPGTVARWNILAYSAVPAFLNVGISPLFAQVVFRFAECATLGITPVFAYFVVYLGFLDKYNQDINNFTLKEAIKYQLPYSLAIGGILLALLIIWYIIGLPLGINGSIAV